MGVERNHRKSRKSGVSLAMCRKQRYSNGSRLRELTFRVYKAVDKPDQFRYWTAMVRLDSNCPEVVALVYLNEPVEIAADIMSWVLWAIVNIRMGGTWPFQDNVSDMLPLLVPREIKYQEPMTADFPRLPTFHPDIRFKKQEKWEQLCAWVQYWLEAYIHMSRPHHYFSRGHRSESQMVLYIMYHLNEILPTEAPLCLDVIMANTGWNVVRVKIRKDNPNLLRKITLKETKQVAIELREREIVKTRERNKAENNVKRLTPLIRNAAERYRQARKKADEERQAN